jgi:hypothetical protein
MQYFSMARFDVATGINDHWQAILDIIFGGMAERSKAAVLKTVNRKVRGFESCSLRQKRNQRRDG